uniref:Uncharacterized protein n=1 Tax=Glossina pallidipes TaxID=7398 RepID=A0A1B0AFN1_GLOPL
MIVVGSAKGAFSDSVPGTINFMQRIIILIPRGSVVMIGLNCSAPPLTGIVEHLRYWTLTLVIVEGTKKVLLAPLISISVRSKKFPRKSENVALSTCVKDFSTLSIFCATAISLANTISVLSLLHMIFPETE